MRITRFEAENFKRLKAVDITPGDGSTVVIGGRNAQGKSSVLDGIMAALAGKKGAKELSRPIRDGEQRASVVVETEDLRVERRWTASGSTVTVSPKGSTSKLSSPQAVLDKLIGSLAFDPLEFAEADPKTQVETLIDIVGREQFDKIAEARKACYENRTHTNREVKRYRGEVESRADAREVEPVEVRALFDEAEVARKRAALKDEWERLEARMAEIRAEVSALPTARPLEEINALLANADEINREAQRWIDRKAAEQYLAEAERESASYTEMIENLDQQKADLIAKAPLPVPGLGFTEDGVTFNGVPFQQSSAAERLKVSVGMAMAMNPDLRVICVRDASLLDDDSKRALAAMATEHDYQIWLEVVGDPGEVGVLIEDGQVAR